MRVLLYFFIIFSFFGCVDMVEVKKQDSVLQYSKKLVTKDEVYIISYLSKALMLDDDANEKFFVSIYPKMQKDVKFLLNGKEAILVTEATDKEKESYTYEINPWYEYKIVEFKSSLKSNLKFKIGDNIVIFRKYQN